MHDLCYNSFKKLLLNFQINNLKLPQIPQMLCINQKTLGKNAAKQWCNFWGLFPDCFLSLCGENSTMRGKDQLLPLDRGVHWTQITSFKRFTDLTLQNHRTETLKPSTWPAKPYLGLQGLLMICRSHLNRSVRCTHWPRYYTLTLYIKLDTFGN